MSGGEKRRHTRFRVNLVAALVKGKDSVPIVVLDASYRGVFLRTDTPSPLRSLVRLRVSLSPSGPDVMVHGMVVHVEPPGSREPGMGVEFMALEGPTKQAWDAFVAERQRQAPASMRRPVPSTPPGAVVLELSYTPANVDELQAVFQQEMSRGSLSLRADPETPVLTPVRVTVTHPRTLATFMLAGVVRRRILQPSYRGLGLELAPFHDGIRAELARFVAGEASDDDSVDIEISA